VIEPEATELPQVIVGACGCVLRADSLPAGFRFVATPTGDKRVSVYACSEHTRLGALSPSSQPAPVKAPANRRSRRPGRAVKAPVAS
jgi:hypothetical protein